MVWKRVKYQSLEPQDYCSKYRFCIRLLLCCLIIIQFTILLIWISTFFTQKSQHDPQSDFDLDKIYFNPKDLLFMETNSFEEYNEKFLEREGLDRCAKKNDSEKFDCHPEPGADESSCLKRGCCWEVKKTESVLLDVPDCYYPSSYGGYQLVNTTHSRMGIRAFLKRTFPSPYPDDVQLIRMEVQYQSSDRLHVKILDANSNRYEPPYPDIPTGYDPLPRDPEYQVLLSSYGFKILRNNGDIIFNAENVGGFIFADQFLQISATFAGKIYGLGEHQSTLQLDTNWKTFTMFNHDGVPVINVGDYAPEFKLKNEPSAFYKFSLNRLGYTVLLSRPSCLLSRIRGQANLYGSHPFYLVLEPSGKCHGVFFHNSNAMDVILQPLPAITFRSIGGIFDFYFFTGPTPADVIKQYTEVIGRPFLPPYWSLGFHLSRLGYKNTKDIKSVWSRTRRAEIPFDTQWHDIDYMERRNDFTYDPTNYKDLKSFVEEVHKAGMHYIPIIDPGISGCEPNGTYQPYEDGIASDVFVKNNDGSLFVGKVWNSKCTVFPDFTAPQTKIYWSNQIRKFHDVIPFDGLWIDMNEPSNFLDGSLTGCPESKWESPVYVPDVVGGKLRDKTICMSARQFAGLHYNVHNLYGISEAVATNRALKELGKRPFIISRSTYPGAGRFAGHWSGDVVSTWNAMKKSIPQMLSFSLFGIPMMGADICGFNGNTTAILCQRWSQLGAFYPFSRNHNTDDAIDQDPVAFGEEVINSTRKALMVRYTLLPYLYTLFYKAHTEGETVARPLFFEFGKDPNTHNIDESFLWGCWLLIVPVLKEYATTVKTYFPSSRWYDWYTGLGIESNGTYIVVHAASDTIPVFVRGGVVLPTQSPNVTTTLSRSNSIELIAAFNTSLYGSGTLYWDDGESLDTISKGEYGIVDFFLTPDNFSSRVKYWKYDKVPNLGSIKILGFVKPIKSIFFNKKEIDYKWNRSSLVLTVDVKYPLNLPFTLSWKMAKEF